MRKNDSYTQSTPPVSIKTQPNSRIAIYFFTLSHCYRADPPDLLPSYLIGRAYMCIRKVIIGFPHASVAVTACLTVREIMAESLRSETDWLRFRVAQIFVAIVITMYERHKGKRSPTFSDKGKQINK